MNLNWSKIRIFLAPVHHVTMQLHCLATIKTGFKAWHSSWGHEWMSLLIFLQPFILSWLMTFDLFPVNAVLVRTLDTWDEVRQWGWDKLVPTSNHIDLTGNTTHTAPQNVETFTTWTHQNTNLVKTVVYVLACVCHYGKMWSWRHISVAGATGKWYFARCLCPPLSVDPLY